ncbi:MAG: hypothetical protein ACFB4I_08880 [Cyanophyceae cyanobacterium]
MSRNIEAEGNSVAILIREGVHFVEMMVVERIPKHLPTPGDTHFRIKVQSHGFTGQGWTWIGAPSLENFVEQLRKLENHRQGSGELSSLSPQQFWLQISSVDSLGHIAVAGQLAQLGHGVGGEHLLKFGFELDPNTLLSIVKNFEAVVASEASVLGEIE